MCVEPIPHQFVWKLTFRRFSQLNFYLHDSNKAVPCNINRVTPLAGPSSINKSGFGIYKSRKLTDVDISRDNDYYQNTLVEDSFQNFTSYDEVSNKLYNEDFQPGIKKFKWLGEIYSIILL